MSEENVNYLKNDLPSDWTENNEKFRETLAERIVSLSEHIWSQVKDSQRDVNKENNIYWGKVGIAYMYWLLSNQNSFLNREKQLESLSRANTLIESSLMGPNGANQSFLFGESGRCFVAGLIFDSIGFTSYHILAFNDMAENHLTDKYEDKHRYTLAEGRAGFIMALLLVNNSFNYHIIPLECIQNIGISLIKSGKFDALSNKSELPIIFENKNGLTLDLSEGMTGPLLALLCIPELFKFHPQFKEDIKKAIDSIVSKQSSDGSYFSDPKNPDPDNWYYGSAGVSFLIAKAYHIWSEDKYKKSLENCGEYLWKRCLKKSGPAISTGISGFGYAFLMIYRSIGNEIYLNRAKQLANYMIQNSYFQQNDKLKHPFSLFEGWPGLVCYLIHVYDPSSASIPLFCDLFSKRTVEMTENIDSIGKHIEEIQSNKP